MNNMNKPCLLCKSIFKPRIIMLEEVLNNNTQSSHLQQLCISGGVSSEKVIKNSTTKDIEWQFILTLSVRGPTLYVLF